MTTAWSQAQLERIEETEELRIATKRADGTLRRWLPIWVVSVGEQVYVRTWYRRDSGWFAHALDSRRARIRVPDLVLDVTVEDLGDDRADLRVGVDDAYRCKYERYGNASVDRMVNDAAAATTLRLIPEHGAHAHHE